MPVEDRAADAWEPLIAVADLAGGTSPDLARAACVTLTETRDANVADSPPNPSAADCRPRSVTPRRWPPPSSWTV